MKYWIIVLRIKSSLKPTMHINTIVGSTKIVPFPLTGDTWLRFTERK